MPLSYKHTAPAGLRSSNVQSGFTLVELAIVLVIIGLIIGGVLVGQDMIKAAEVRATTGQIEKYNATINTFRDKYQFIPGDVNNAAATRFGFTTRTGAVGHGDGNGILEGCSAGASVAGCETTLFWRDLNQASLIDGSFVVASDATATAATPSAVASLIPEAKLGRGNRISVYGWRGTNFYQIGSVTALAAGVPTTAASLTPQEAFNIDAKLDDGRPGTGVVRSASSGTGVAYNATADNSVSQPAACALGGASPTDYATADSATVNAMACHLRIRFN